MKRHAHVLTTRQQHFKLASSTQTHGMCKTRTGLFLVLRQTERNYANGRRGRKSTGHACTGSVLPFCLCHPKGCHHQCNAAISLCILTLEACIPEASLAEEPKQCSTRKTPTSQSMECRQRSVCSGARAPTSTGFAESKSIR